MGRIVVIMLCAALLLVGYQPEYPGDMPGPQEAFYVRPDTLEPYYATGETLWIAGWDGSGRYPIAIIDTIGNPQPLCKCWEKSQTPKWTVEARCAVMGCECLQAIWTGNEWLEVEDRP